MRSTLSIDDDVLAAAKDLAMRQHKSVGEVISALVRQPLRSREPGHSSRNGVPLLHVRANIAPVTLELLDQLREELPEHP